MVECVTACDLFVKWGTNRADKILLGKKMAGFVLLEGFLPCSEGAFGVDYARRRDSISL